jgi:hypothetical protein
MATDELIVQKIRRLVDDNPGWTHEKVSYMVDRFCDEQKILGIVLEKPSVRTVGRQIATYKSSSRHALLMEAVAKDKAEPGSMWVMIEETNKEKAELIIEARADHYLFYGYIPEDITLENARLIWNVKRLSRDMPAFMAYQVGTDYYHRRLLATYTKALAEKEKNEALVIDEDTKDLEDFVILQPWRSPEYFNNYITAIRIGAVRRINKEWIRWTPIGSLPLEDYEPIYDEDGTVKSYKRVKMDGKPYPPTTKLLDNPMTPLAIQQVKESFRRFREEFNKE